VEKPNSVIVYSYKYLIGADDSTNWIIFGNQQLYSAVKTRQVAVYVETHYNIASKRVFPTGTPDRWSCPCG